VAVAIENPEVAALLDANAALLEARRRLATTSEQLLNRLTLNQPLTDDHGMSRGRRLTVTTVSCRMRLNDDDAPHRRSQPDLSLEG
jgi:hypothetical protein